MLRRDAMETTGREWLEQQITIFFGREEPWLAPAARYALADRIYNNWMQVSTQVIDDLVEASNLALASMETAALTHPDAAYELAGAIENMQAAVARAKRYLAVPETGTRERIGISLKENPRDHFSGSRRCEHGR